MSLFNIYSFKDTNINCNCLNFNWINLQLNTHGNEKGPDLMAEQFQQMFAQHMVSEELYILENKLLIT